MQVKDFSGYGFSNITFDLYPGEILGIAGVVGAGRTELISTIFGRDKALGGKVILDGRRTSRACPPRRFCRRASTSCRKTATTTAFSKSARFLPIRPPRC